MTERRKNWTDCPVCKEKQKEIVRILTAYKKDKKLYLTIIGVLGAAFLFYAIYGRAWIEALKQTREFIP